MSRRSGEVRRANPRAGNRTPPLPPWRKEATAYVPPMLVWAIALSLLDASCGLDETGGQALGEGMIKQSPVYDVHVIGGGLAGCEAAWQLAQRGFSVRLSEMRGATAEKGGTMTPAHQSDGLAELVCSNSFRSDDDERNAVGLLHHEMRQLDSLIMRAGEKARVPAGSAMAVDRDAFSAEVP